MQTKASKVEHTSLLNRFNIFSGVENIKHFREHYVPKLEAWEQQIEDLLESNMEVRECIVKFDQDLSMKCNKSALMAFKIELNTDFIPMSDKKMLEDMV